MNTFDFTMHPKMVHFVMYFTIIELGSLWGANARFRCEQQWRLKRDSKKMTIDRTMQMYDACNYSVHIHQSEKEPLLVFWKLLQIHLHPGLSPIMDASIFPGGLHRRLV